MIAANDFVCCASEFGAIEMLQLLACLLTYFYLYIFYLTLLYNFCFVITHL